MSGAPAERERLLDELRRAWDGDPWHGDSLRVILTGLTEDAAAARPLPSAHNAWEIALHLAGWTREVTRRLRDRVARDPENGDWPAVGGTWEGAVDALARAQADLLDAVAAFPPETLDEIVGEARDRPLGSGVSYAVMLHGIAQHYAYHAGQVALLRKATG
ncbi:DinB family protein [Longimicrobium sp.]|uniref:DinB family protein n=1 Tax=Longimicrobium sp. TaxID=2029185 RepID=UPI002E2EF9BE|nr:DinB family protein [Longimicrobium sp.]HEX6038381.1 DinB family protein [Longimicrobium sp.]